MTGYDFDLINIAKNKINLPIIASGGAGNYEDMYKAIDLAISKIDRQVIKYKEKHKNHRQSDGSIKNGPAE